MKLKSATVPSSPETGWVKISSAKEKAIMPSWAARREIVLCHIHLIVTWGRPPPSQEYQRKQRQAETDSQGSARLAGSEAMPLRHTVRERG